MKKLFIIAAALALFSACNKQMEFTCEQDLTYKTLSVSAAQTKTTLNAEGGIDWLATDNLAVLESAGESTTTYKSGNANIAAEGGATFAVEIATIENDSFTYNAIYPYSALTTTTNPSAANVSTPTTQKPSASSFDPAADLLIAETIVESTQPSSISARFMRMVAIGKVTLNGIAAGEYVRSVELVFPEAVAGKRVIDLSNAEVVSVDAAASQSIRLDYSAQSIEANAMTAYFTCFPIKMKAGDSFTVKLRTTADSYYEKTITLSGEQILEFYNGRISEFSIDMSAAKQVVEFPVVFPMGWQDTDGDGNTDLGWCSLDRPWVVDWINSPAYDNNKVKDSKLSGEAGRLYSYYQPQATLKWVWDEKIASTGVKHYTEVTNRTKNIGSIGIKGVWTDDYFEFVLPVKNFAANTTLNLKMHIYHRLAPVFWEVLYKDGEEWKSTAVDDLLGGIDAKTSAEVRRRATWAIPRIESNATTESTQTVDMPFVNAIEDGNVVIRVKCVDGSLAGNTSNTVSTLTAPYNSSKVASMPLYFSNPADRADSDIVISIVE